MFGEKWFRKTRPGHPAYLRWELIGKYLDRDGIIDGPANTDEMTALGRAVLDSHLLVALAGGNLEPATSALTVTLKCNTSSRSACRSRTFSKM
ncbi:MAG: hypothetical protein EHJ95_06325 [Methanobacteriota archaeon]|nr:MAG: hypothetical protein EHJ95_06325 [Euryarchaeota archaeon]